MGVETSARGGLRLRRILQVVTVAALWGGTTAIVTAVVQANAAHGTARDEPARAASAPEATQGSATIGRTYPIVEPDALAEIEGRVARLPRDLSSKFGPRSSWSALRAAPLGVAAADRVRTVVPFYTLDFDIRLPDGRTLYPKGYVFNPLRFVRLAQRLVIVAPGDLSWALKTARETDFILVTGGDAITLSERSGRPIYILEERVKARLGLTVAPVIVEQTGQKLLLTEFGARSRPGTSARPLREAAR
jgi:conjugal transfer pilus assembly protein TraW